VPIVDVQARFDVAARAAREAIPDRQLNGGMGPWDVAALRPLSDVLAGRQRSTFQLVFVTALVLVLLGCVNVSGLVASRGIERHRELALRRALGASQSAIARLLVAELAVLFGVGTLIGVAASRPAVTLAVRLLPENMGLLREPALDGRVMAFAALATALSIAIVAIWPLRQSRRVTLSSAMADGAHASASGRPIGRFAVVSLQVALGFALTLAGVLLVGSLVRIWQTDVGYATDDLLIVEGSVEGSDARGRHADLGNFLDSVRAIPGVTAVGATGASLLRSGAPGGMWRGHTYAVTAGFFDAVPVAVVDGRLPSNDELRTGAAVAAITERVAAHYFPAQPAVGQLLREEGPGGNAFTVVGLVQYARYGGWTSGEESGGQIYIPLVGGRRFSAVVRTAPAAGPLLQPILEAARAWPVQLSTAAAAEGLLIETIRSHRFQAWLFGTFAGGALTIVGIGVLGLMAITTARRTREMAIRLTLGARPRSIVRLMLGEQLAPIVAGLAGGCLVSVWVARSVRTYLYETTPFDPAIWSATAAAILAVALVGILIPARRATRLDPARVLRAE
jgi:predicted permease